VPLGSSALSFQRELNPIWIVRFVLAEYGTGAVMGVPAPRPARFRFCPPVELPVKRG